MAKNNKILNPPLEKKNKPLLKWVGGKSQLLNHILPKAPKKYKKYIEPFIGGGAVFFALNHNNSIISDSNDELINLYQIVKTHPKELIKILNTYNYSSEDYYQIESLIVTSFLLWNQQQEQCI